MTRSNFPHWGNHNLGSTYNEENKTYNWPINYRRAFILIPVAWGTHAGADVATLVKSVNNNNFTIFKQAMSGSHHFTTMSYISLGTL